MFFYSSSPFCPSYTRNFNPLLSESDASFTGNISEWEWSRGNTTYAYSLEYDALSRIKESRLFRNGNLVDALSESGISYDSNGNILSLTRTGEDGSAVNDLSYHYDGNRLTSLSDGDVQSQNYTYDADGNMTFDGRTGMSLTWNDLGLVKKVSLNDTDLVNYSYLADGTKVSALDDDGDGLLYLGSLIYKKQGESISLESAGFAGGRFVARNVAGGDFEIVPMFHVTDHLGSVRAVVDGVSGEVVETNDYYPFGSRWDVAAGLKDDTNRFRYNSKEEQFNFGTPYIDYGARQYDPVLGRWFAQDPLSEKYYGISPYAFCAGNPVKYLDPDGRKLYFADDTSSEFKQKFLEAVLFMNSKGTSGHIAALHESDVVYYITNLPKGSEEIGKNMSKFDWQNTTIYWDYTHFALTSRNIYLSPATVLAHEVAHAVRYDEAIKSGTKSRWISETQSGTDNQYDSIEERAVITTTEQIVALKHGEIDSEQVTRTDHNGKLCYETVADSSPEDISKTAYERNVIWK